MHVTDLAINQALGMRLTAAGSAHVLEMPDAPLLRNHLGTIHASAQFALAEAASGEFLLAHLDDGRGEAVAVLRRAEVKFRSAARGDLRAKAQLAEGDIEAVGLQLAERGRVLVAMLVEVIDAQDVVTLSGRFEWFAQRGIPAG